MTHIVLLGDSIFDNASYVSPGESVTEILSSIVEENTKVSLLAVDGDVTTDVKKQLKKFPKDATNVFISCGGNDALQHTSVLTKRIDSVNDAMEIFTKVREQFRRNYNAMLKDVLKNTNNVTICTVYNSVPGIGESALTALSLFNEVILSEAVINKLPLIDLRVVCREEDDYSSISPIEPSGQGARKIANVIRSVVCDQGVKEVCKIYA